MGRRLICAVMVCIGFWHETDHRRSPRFGRYWRQTGHGKVSPFRKIAEAEPWC